jgi:hypothetical protein
MLDDDLRRHAGKYYGKHSGSVTKNDQDTDNMGRISVTVPSIFGVDVEVVARPCLPYGHFFVPAVGTKVWIEFEGGDINYPIWVGTWYPQGTTPPQAAISPPDNRVIQTASGHTVEIMDKDGEEKITIKHKGNSFITIDKDGTVLIANQKGSYLQLDAKDEGATIVEQHGNILTMGSDGVTITDKSGNSTIQMTSDSVRIMGSAIILQAPSVSLTGEPAAEPTILATTFGPLMNAWMVGHTHPSAMGPTGPPLPAPPPPMIVTGAPFLSSGTVLK